MVLRILISHGVLQEEGANVTANALHPGSIATGLGSQIFVKSNAHISMVVSLLIVRTTEAEHCRFCLLHRVNSHLHPVMKLSSDSFPNLWKCA